MTHIFLFINLKTKKPRKNLSVGGFLISTEKALKSRMLHLLLKKTCIQTLYIQLKITLSVYMDFLGFETEELKKQISFVD